MNIRLFFNAMKKMFLTSAILCLLAMMNSCVVIDYNGFCDMYVKNESGHSVEFDVYDECGRFSETITLTNGEFKKIHSYVDMGYAPVDPQRIFHDTAVFRFDGGISLTHTGTLYEDKDYHMIVKPFYPEKNNIFDISSWKIVSTMKNKHCPLETGVYTLTEEDYLSAESQTIP